MKIKLSKSQWELVGKKTGWIKQAASGLEDIPEGKSKPAKETPPKDKEKYISEDDFATKAQLTKLKDDVMDKYNKGEITKEQLKMWLEEFSKRKIDHIKLSKKQWELVGKKAGWITAELDNDEEEADRLSFTFGTTPEKVIKDRVLSQTPSGYPMHIKSQEEWTEIANAVNKGIDSHLEAFTRSKFNNNGEVLIHPEEMTTFLRRLLEAGNDVARELRSAILETLGIEEI